MKNAIFCTCEKCDTKINTHNGFVEAPPGHYVFAIKCLACKFKFAYHYSTEKYLKTQKQDNLKQLMHPKFLSKIVKGVKSEIDKEED